MFINVRECYIVALFSYYFALYIVHLLSVVYDKKLHIAMYTYVHKNNSVCYNNVHQTTRLYTARSKY